MQSIRISGNKKLSWDKGWLLADVCLVYWVKLASFPESCASFSSFESANQKETKSPGNEVKIKKKMFCFIQIRHSQMMGKSSKYVIALAHPPGRTKILRDKNISKGILKISKFPLHSTNYSFLPLFKTLKPRLTKTTLQSKPKNVWTSCLGLQYWKITSERKWLLI